MLDGGLYKLIIDHVKLVHSSGKLDDPSSLEEAYGEHAWFDAMEESLEPTVESDIGSRLSVDGSIVEQGDWIV